MTLQLLHSEFPYIWGKFEFIFYQCMTVQYIYKYTNGILSIYGCRLHTVCKWTVDENVNFRAEKLGPKLHRVSSPFMPYSICCATDGKTLDSSRRLDPIWLSAFWSCDLRDPKAGDKDIHVTFAPRHPKIQLKQNTGRSDCLHFCWQCRFKKMLYVNMSTGMERQDLKHNITKQRAKPPNPTPSNGAQR